MEGKIRINKKVILYLNDDEAAWLQGIMQNPLHLGPNDSPEDEPKRDETNRHNLFHLIKSLRKTEN